MVYILHLALFCFGSGLGAQDAKQAGRGYNSLSGGIERGTDPKKKPVYSVYQLRNLRKALSPRYIRVLDQKEYALSGKILQRGILFTYDGRKVKNVAVAGNFNNWSEMPMQRNRMGIFFYLLPLRLEDDKKLDVYRYKFITDGVWTYDPNNHSRASDGMAGYYSLFYLDEDRINRQVSVRVLKKQAKSGGYWVEFAIHLPNVKNLALVGSFNNWNPEHDTMLKEDTGIFRRRLRLRPGSYVYKYIADGKRLLDKYNESTRFDPKIQELSSYIEVP